LKIVPLHVFLADFRLGHAITNTQGAGTAIMIAGTLGFRHLNNWRVKESELSAMCMHWEGWWQSYLEDNPFGSIHPFIWSYTRWLWRACFLQPTISHSQSGVLCEIVFASDRQSTANILCQLTNLKVQ